VPEDQLPEDLDIPVPEPETAPEPVPDDTMIIRLRQQDAAMPAEDVEKLRDRVIEAYLRYRKQDAFDLLGLDEDAGLVALQDAFVDYSRRFAPWQYEDQGLESVGEKARDLFLAGGQAFAELSDVDKRNALIMRRRRLREEKSQRPSADRFAIKSDLLDSELQFKKGKSLMAQGKYRDALKQLQFAFDMDPQNAIYRAELTYCQFLDRPQGEAERARAELRETLRIDPKCGLAFYYLGMVEMHLERYDEAETQLQRAIKLMMPDRRPIEGLKDLQTRAKKRKKLGFL
ncbi:MAG: tetratricopeptide repeat protein, partial [Acidobacteriota bacterium]